MKKNTLKGMSFSSLRAKLMSTVAMLLVASTLLVTSSYAWFVMSTAPEVTGIDTQVGANGALEIALLNEESWNNLSRLDMGDIDESAAGDTAAAALAANLTWGNLVNLADPSYGLSKIILQPARLNITSAGADGEGTQQYKVAPNLLKTPVYSEDGRIQKLASNAAEVYVCSDGKFTAEGHGVRAIGTCANVSVFQAGMNTAKTLLSDGMSKAKEAASKTLRDNGVALADIVVEHTLNNKNEGFTEDNINSVRALAEGLQTALGHLESALRQVFAGFVATGDVITDTARYEAAVAAINDPNTTLDDLLRDYSGIKTLVPEIETYIDLLKADQTKVETAIANCDRTSAPCNWDTIAGIVSPLADPNQMTLGGKTLEQVKAEVFNKDGSINMGAAVALISGGVKIGVPSGSGILADIADYAGNYAAVVTLKNIEIKGIPIGDDGLAVTITTVTDKNPVYLSDCSSALRGATVTSGVGSSSMTDFYGYALDLAFRTNAANSQLLLQTEPENRVYEGEKENAALQGGGSFMSFTTGTGTGISANKMVKLMSGIRIAFMDHDQSVLGIATLDCGLGKDLYKPLTDEIKNTHSDLDYEDMAYYLDASKGGVQQSDLITQAAYDALPEKSEVAYDEASGEIKAKLYMREFSRTVSTAPHTDEEVEKNGGPFYTGGITIGNKVESKAITKLVQDSPKAVTAVVYIDGSVVTNATVAANAQYSMTGKLNLQFSSDATLMPAQNSALRDGK